MPGPWKWARFAAWESRAETLRERSLSADLAWLADAMEMARRLAPAGDPLVQLHEKSARPARVRAALSVLGRRPQ